MIHKMGANSTLLASFFIVIIRVKGEGRMDMEKLCDELIKDETLNDIPLLYVLRVALSVLSLINSGKCFYKEDFD